MCLERVARYAVVLGHQKKPGTCTRRYPFLVTHSLSCGIAILFCQCSRIPPRRPQPLHEDDLSE